MPVPLTKSGKPDKRFKKPLPILPEVIPDPQTKEITNIKDLSRFDQFVINTFYMNDYRAAIEAGYSESYAKSHANGLCKTEKYQNKCRDYWPKDARSNLAIQARAKKKLYKAIDLDESGLQYAIHRQIMKEDREEAGVRDCLIPSPKTIKIETLTQIGVMIGQDIARSVSSEDDDVIVGEIVE